MTIIQEQTHKYANQKYIPDGHINEKDAAK
jgi:hypothetical protein